MNECYTCTHRRSTTGDAHTCCTKPDPNMKGEAHGIREGWFWYPTNFDPVWKATLCNNYTEKTK
jgi:hypothetical protein